MFWFSVWDCYRWYVLGEWVSCIGQLLVRLCDTFLTYQCYNLYNQIRRATKNALVIGADALTRWVDWDDRNSCILFGDGAGAMVLSSSKDGDKTDDEGFGILGYSMHSNGGGYDDLKCM
jgi:hypothetical protein